MKCSMRKAGGRIVKVTVALLYKHRPRSKQNLGRREHIVLDKAKTTAAWHLAIAAASYKNHRAEMPLERILSVTRTLSFSSQKKNNNAFCPSQT